MAENKNNFDSRGGSPKRADANRSADINGILSDVGGEDFLQKEKKMRERVRGEANAAIEKKEKKFPIAADIFITLLTVALIVGVVVGAVFLLKYFSFDYDEKLVEYTLLVDKETAALLKEGDDVYCENGGMTAYLGDVKDLPTGVLGEETDCATVTVRVNTKYRKGEGYTAEGVRISVNKDLTLRSGANVYSAKIIELEVVK